MKICSEIDDPRGDLGHHNAINDWGNRPFFSKLFNSNWKSRRPLPPRKNIRREQWQRFIVIDVQEEQGIVISKSRQLSGNGASRK